MTRPNLRDIGAVERDRVVPPGKTRRGLVVGIDRYQNDGLTLRYAAADAQMMYDLMVDPSVGLFPPEQVTLLLNERATHQNVWRALTALGRSGANDQVWIYFAGHGAPEGSDLYWVLHDTDIDNLPDKGLDGRHVQMALEKIKSKQLVTFLDCCHSAANGARANRTRGVATPEQLLAGFNGEGRLTFSSCKANQKCVELDLKGHGAFTYYLAEGLRGSADTDGQGVVTADKLWSYLETKVSEASHTAGCAQDPVMQGEMSHKFALTVNPAVVRKRRKVVEFIDSHTGAEPRLSTEQGKFVAELVCRKPKSPAEKRLLVGLADFIKDQSRLPDFKRLVEASMEVATAATTTGPTAVAAGPLPAAWMSPATAAIAVLPEPDRRPRVMTTEVARPGFVERIRARIRRVVQTIVKVLVSIAIIGVIAAGCWLALVIHAKSSTTVTTPPAMATAANVGSAHAGPSGLASTSGPGKIPAVVDRVPPARSTPDHSGLPDEVTVGREGKYTKIADAIDAVRDGGVVHVTPGIYDFTGVVLFKSVTIAGTGPRDSVVLSGRTRLCTCSNGAAVITFQSLTLQSSDPYNLAAGSSAVWLGHGSLTFRDVVITATATALSIDNASVELYGCELDARDRDDVLTISGGNVTLDHCLLHNGANGVVADGNARATLNDCRVQNLTDDGIRVGGLANVQVNGSRITNTKGYAAASVNGGWVGVSGTVFKDNKSGKFGRTGTGGRIVDDGTNTDQ